MSDELQMLLRAVAEACFNMPPDFTTKDIYKRIKTECDKDKITQCVLKEMYCENTGTNFLDSGGIYGRGWERCQKIKYKDWIESEPVNVDVGRYSDGEYYLNITKNSYLFLCEYLKYDPEMDKRFHTFAEQNEDSWYQNMKQFVNYIDQFDGAHNIGGYNTYGTDSCLDNILQWEIFIVENITYMLLQIHNGCDARGGYSAPHVFTLDYDDFICTIDDLTAKCPNYDKQEPEIEGLQLDLYGNVTKDPLIDLDHVTCYSDDSGFHWYGDCGEDLDTGSQFITDEHGNHKLICRKCGSEIEFW